MDWLDASSPAVRSAVVSGSWGRAPHSDHGHVIPVTPAIDTIADALAAASDILTRLTGFIVHPALVVEEDFVATPKALRLYPSFFPVREVVSVARMGIAGQLAEQAVDWVSFAGAIYFSEDCSSTYDGWYLSACGCRAPQKEYLRVQYRAGSTITASARKAVIALAHDMWLDGAGCEECGLPSRTTSVSREGISYSVGDPADPLGTAMTGLPSVDIWIRATNPFKAVRSSGLYTPDSPPPTVRSVFTARPEWGSTVHLSGSATVDVGASTA
jgi:hypothetical protein